MSDSRLHIWGHPLVSFDPPGATIESDDCGRHSHPKLPRRHRLGLDRFIDDLVWVANRAPILATDTGLTPDTGLVLSATLGRTHEKEPRRYAETHFGAGGGSAVYFAPQVLLLPRTHRIGLIAHELGHILAGPRGSEDAADRAAWEHLRISIDYDRRWPGKGLQRVHHTSPIRRCS